MSETITTAISDRICKHMNKDHADSVAFYVRTYGKQPEAQTAQMLSIDPQGMNLLAKVDGQDVNVRIEFDHSLVDAKDAHHTLVEMLKK